MTGSLDFLPADYVCVHTRRMQARWRRLSLLVLTALVTWGIVNESYYRMQGQETRHAISNRLRSVSRQLTDPAELREELARAEQSAEDLAALELSVRPSRIYAAITAALPADTRLTRLHIASPSGPKFEAALSEVSEVADAEQSGAAQVHVRGVARTDALVARLVDQVEQTGLFRQVHVRRIEQGGDGREFDLRLTVDSPVPQASERLGQLRIRVMEQAAALELPERLREERP
jgi:hypothetical protein